TGQIVRFEPVEGRSDIAAFALQYDEEAVPMSYKMRLSEYLRPIKRSAAKRDADGSNGSG
ncbi:MAG: hypothetical protein MI724_02955, partial [Spirochaetales bacterium]|nr:hypothetical protein [Spirochaetales bacterium]